MKGISTLLFIAFGLIQTVASQTISGVNGQDLNGYPAFEQIAPVNSSLTAFFLNGRNIPGAPRPTGQPPNYVNAVIDCGSNSNYWAISYDDGPAEFEDTILNDLRSRNMPATFFSLGSSVMRFSQAAKKIVDDGHIIAIHTWSHRHLTNLTNDQVVSEIFWTAKVIYDVTGKVPRYARPAYGDIDQRISAILEAMDVVPVIWNRDTLDYLLNTNGRTESNILSDVNNWISQPNPNGVNSLQHDRFRNTANFGPRLHLAVANSNYRPVNMEQCLSTSGRGAAYATSGKLYEAVTGRASITNDPNANTNTPSTGTDNPGNITKNGTTNSTNVKQNSAAPLANSNFIGVITFMFGWINMLMLI